MRQMLNYFQGDQPVLHLKYEHVMNLSKWSRSLYFYLWFCLLAIFLGELVVFCIKYFAIGFPASEPPTRSYIISYIITPSIINVLIMSAASLLIEYFIRRELLYMQAIILLMATLSVCFNVVYVHYVISSIYFVFCIPIMISLFYIDMKPLIFSTLASLASYLSFCFIILPHRSGRVLADQGYMEIIVIMIVLMVLFFLASIVLACLSDLANRIIATNIQVKQDSLTKLLNHASFYDQLDDLIKIYKEKETGFSLIIWDIDGFKQINDRFGHIIGDRVLLCFVTSLKSCLNEYEAAFRYGGEEFAILTHKNATSAELLTRKIRSVFEKQGKYFDLPIHLTASAGICEFDSKVFFGKHEFFAAADKALYKAKRTPGKNTHFVWRPDMDI